MLVAVLEQAFAKSEVIAEGGSANLQVRKASLQVRGDHCEKVYELLWSTVPGRARPTIRRRHKVRLVPNLPILDIPVEAIRPSLIVMANDMFTNHCPLVEILWGIHAVFLDPMLNGLAKPVEGLRPRSTDILQIFVRQGEIITFGILGIRLEIREDASDVHGVPSAVGMAVRRVMQAGVGNLQRGERVEIRHRLVAPRL